MTGPIDQNALAIARDIARVRRSTGDQARASQANRRSVELTANMNGVNYYKDGERIATVGLNPRGDFVIQREPEVSPTPPTPSAPFAVGRVGGVEVSWNGTYENGEIWSGSVGRIEIHALAAPGDPTTDLTQIGTFTSKLGGAMFYSINAAAGELFYCLQVVSVAEVESPASLTTPATGIDAVDQEAWQEHEDALDNLNNVTLPALEEALDDNATLIDNLTTVVIPDLQDDVDAAADTVKTRVRVVFNTAQPAGLGVDDRVIWYDTDDGNAASYWDGSSWGPYSLGAGALAADSVTAIQIAAGQVFATELAADSVIAAKIQAGAVVAGKIAANAVTATEIAADAVIAAKIQAGAIVAGKIAANAVTATTIATDAVIAAKIQAGAVTAGKIAADAVTATEIAANAVVAGKIAAGAVTATTLAADAITTNSLQANAITSKHTITGAAFRTAALGERVEIDTTFLSRVRFFSGAVNESQPSFIEADDVYRGNTDTPHVVVQGGVRTGFPGTRTPARLSLLTRSTNLAEAELQAQTVFIGARDKDAPGTGDKLADIVLRSTTTNPLIMLSVGLNGGTFTSVELNNGQILFSGSLTGVSGALTDIAVGSSMNLATGKKVKTNNVEVVNPSAWTALTPINGWTVTTFTGEAPEVIIINGVGWVRGLVKTAGSSTVVMFVLPLGMRPTRGTFRTFVASSVGTHQVDIDTAGQVLLPTGAGAGASSYVSVCFQFPII